MSSEIILLLVLAAGVAYWYWQKNRSNITSMPEIKTQESIFQPLIRNTEEIDSFLRSIKLEKERSEAAISDARRQHMHELETRFANDMNMKKRLSEFARDQKLDVALSNLWKEIRCYPAWSTNNFKNWNKFQMVGISGSEEEGIKSVEFCHEDRHFKITERKIYGSKGQCYSDITFFEDSEEVFAINCLIDIMDDLDIYRSHSITTFKKHGNWPQVILWYNAKIQIEQHKHANLNKFLGADEIKFRFEE